MGAPPIRLNQRIAPICRVYDVNGKTEVEVIREGMTREEIMDAFPSKKPHGYNRLALIKAVVFEAHNDVVEGGKKRELKNFRAVAWYELLFHLLMTTLQEDPQKMGHGKTIESTITKAWEELLNDGHITYGPFNLFTEKQKAFRIGIREDSPYPRTLLLVEKVSLFPTLQDLADVYGINFVATGGKPSRLAAIQFTKDLESLGIDLGEDFTIYSFADCDPEGWRIPETFIRHLKFKIAGNIKLVRLGVLPSQVTESVLEYRTMPYPLEGDTEAARKARRTLYENFARESGGVYLTGDHGEPIPARVELDLYEPSHIREKLVQGLCDHLEGFRWQVEALKEEIERQFESCFDATVEKILDDEESEKDPDPRLEEIDNEKYDLKNEAATRTVEEDKELSVLWAQIKTLSEMEESQSDKLEKETDTKIWELEEEVAGMKKGYKKELADNLERLSNETSQKQEPLYDRVKELERLKYDKTGDLQDQIRWLGREEDGIWSGEIQARERERADIIDSLQIDSTPKFLEHIETNGGWEEWMGEYPEIETLTSDDLEKAAEERTVLEWRVKRKTELILRAKIMNSIGESSGTYSYN